MVFSQFLSMSSKTYKRLGNTDTTNKLEKFFLYLCPKVNEVKLFLPYIEGNKE